jgi:hypothetical protein
MSAFCTYSEQCQPAYLAAIAHLASNTISNIPRSLPRPTPKMGAHGFSHAPSRILYDRSSQSVRQKKGNQTDTDTTRQSNTRPLALADSRSVRDTRRRLCGRLLVVCMFYSPAPSTSLFEGVGTARCRYCMYMYMYQFVDPRGAFFVSRTDLSLAD